MADKQTTKRRRADMERGPVRDLDLEGQVGQGDGPVGDSRVVSVT